MNFIHEREHNNRAGNINYSNKRTDLCFPTGDSAKEKSPPKCTSV